MKRSILNDPRYPEFVERYHADPCRFAIEVTGFRPSLDQEDLLYAIVPRDAKVSVVSGTGCFAAGTQMMRSSGDAVAVEDIRVGDRLMGPDGASVRNVLELKRGREAMYRFTYQDGTSHVFNESHILCLVNTYDKNKRRAGDMRNVTVREYLGWNASWKRSHAIYRSGVESFERPAEPLPVPPYLLGLWLGDGNSSKPELCSGDYELLEAWADYAKSLKCTVRVAVNGENSWVVSGSRVKGTKQANPMSAALRAAGVFQNKNIPDAYLYASLEDRLQLLAGLLDTDGSFDANSGGFDWVQKDEAMARRFWWLARSVGCHATITKSSKVCVNNGVRGNYWRVYISRGAERIPVRLERRKPAGRETVRTHLWHGIKSVEPLGEGDYFGFVLDGDSRFLGHDFTVLHNTGKTAAFGRIALWHMLCHPVAIVESKVEIGSNTYIGAPVVQQVADGVWKELNDCAIAIAAGPHAWVLEYFTITKTRVFMHCYGEQWFIARVALQKGKSISIAGKHRYWQLIIIDEAAGVSDEHAKVIDGTQTSAGNRTLLASQGARNAGWFYDSHHTLNRAKGGSWHSLCFSSERSPFVTMKWLEEREVECGGRDSVEYRIRVRGQFADNSANNLLTRGEMESAFVQRRLIGDDEPYGIMVLSDVALGEYRDDSVAVVAKVIGYGDFGPDARRVEFVEIPICSNAKNEIDLAGDLVDIVAKQDNATLLVDNGGVGATVCKLIERSGGVVTRVDWGKPCFAREYQARFYNLRACAMVRFRDAIRQGRVVMPPGLEQRLREKIIDQGARLPYHFSEAGGLRYVMNAKEDMRKEGIKSPDLIDAMSFVFLEGAVYTARAGGTGLGGEGGGVQSVLERMRAQQLAQQQEQGEATA